jgi:hypothetical protein
LIRNVVEKVLSDGGFEAKAASSGVHDHLLGLKNGTLEALIGSKPRKAAYVLVPTP